MSELHDLSVHFWGEIFSRSSGPMAFRFVLQPIMAGLLAIRDGRKDAREGRDPYFWSILHDPTQRRARLREGFHAVARVILLGIVMDVAYQYLVLKAFRPVEMIVVVALLAFVPYLLVRGPAQRITRYWMRRPSPSGRTPTASNGE